MSYENLSPEIARRIIRDLKIDKPIHKHSRKKSPTFVSFQISGYHQHPITTTSTIDVLKFIFGELLHDLDRRSPASIKGMIAEAGEWMAQVEPSLAMQSKIRKLMASLMLFKSRDKLIIAVGSFAASLGEKYGKFT